MSCDMLCLQLPLDVRLSLKYVFSYMFENEMYIKYLVSSILVKLTGAPLMFLLRFHIQQLSMFVYLMLIALLITTVQ